MEIKKRISGTWEYILAQVYKDIFKLVGNLNAVKIDKNLNISTQDARSIKVSGKKMGEYKNQGTLFLGKETNLLHPEIENNEYINLDEFYEGLKDYFIINRNKTYIVKDETNVFGIAKKKKLSKKELELFDYKIKECSAIILEKTNDPYQDKRSVFVRENGGYEKKVGAISLGKESKNIKKGFEGVILPDDKDRVEYINKKELQTQLREIFKDKTALPGIIMALIALGVVSSTRVEKIKQTDASVVINGIIITQETTTEDIVVYSTTPTIGDIAYITEGTRYFESPIFEGRTNIVGNTIRPEGYYTIDRIAILTNDGKLLAVLNERGEQSYRALLELAQRGVVSYEELDNYGEEANNFSNCYVAYHVNYGDSMNHDRPTGWIRYNPNNCLIAMHQAEGELVSYNNYNEHGELEFDAIFNFATEEVDITKDVYNHYTYYMNIEDIMNNNKQIILNEGQVLVPISGEIINYVVGESLLDVQTNTYYRIIAVEQNEVDSGKTRITFSLNNVKTNFEDLIRMLKRD